MEICKNFVKADPVISATLKKNQPPVCDAFGPFPDETLLSSIDRMLFFMGARKVQKYFNLPTPSCDGLSNSECSVSISCPDERGRYRSCSILCGDRPVCSLSKPSCCATKCCLSRMLCPGPKQRSSVTINDTVSLCGDDTSPKRPRTPMKRSFSLCSLACRKLKQIISFQSQAKEGSSVWLWTRMKTCSNGARVFEVYENSNLSNKPPNIKCTRPKMIFVVLGNGIIVPFESLRHHK